MCWSTEEHDGKSRQQVSYEVQAAAAAPVSLLIKPLKD